MPPKFIIFLLFIQILQINSNDCYTYLLDDTVKFTPCSSPELFSATSLSPIVKNPSKELTVAITMEIRDLCSVVPDVNFLTVSINTSSGRKKVMMLTLKASGQIAFRSQGSTGVIRQFLTTSTTSYFQKPFNVYLSVNLTPGANMFSAGWFLVDENNVAKTTKINYGNDWVFDSSLKISVCADYDGTNLFDSLSCNAQNLKVAYSVYSDSSIINYANSATMLADYKLNEGKGNTLIDSKKSLGPITLATGTSPDWSSDTGLEFTSPAQSFEIPNFVPSTSGLSIEASMSFVFYLKIDTEPSGEDHILSYYCDSIPSNVFSLHVVPGRFLKSEIETVTNYGAYQLVLGEWTQVYIGILYAKGGLGTLVVHVNGVADSNPSITRIGSTAIFSSLDVLMVGGGFTGHIRRFQIYSPGAFQIGSNTCDPKCAIHLGFSAPPTCIQPICSINSGTYLSFGSCEKCSTGCASCLDDTACLLCASGYDLNGTICIPQPRLPETLQDTLTSAQLVNSALTQAANIISKGSSISLSAMIAGKIFSQIKYLNISYSEELQVALLTWLPSFVSLGLTPNMPESIEEKVPERDVPYIFEKYEVPSSFLRNFWENLGIIVAATVIWLSLKMIEHFFATSSQSSSCIRKARVMTQNFLIALLYGVYGDLLMFSVLEYRTIKFGWNLSLLSFLISVTLLVVMSVSFCYQTNLLITYQKLKKQEKGNLEKLKKDHEGSQVLFKDFKDYSITPQLFLFSLSARDLIFSLLLATVLEDPLIQILIFFVLTCLMMAYLLICKPFESTFNLLQQLFFEMISFAVSITVLINAALDVERSTALSARSTIGKFIIVCNLIFNFGTALLMLYIIFTSLKESYNSYKQKTNQKKTIIKLNCNRPQGSSFSASQSELFPKTNESFDIVRNSNKIFPSHLNSEIEFYSLDPGFNNLEPQLSRQRANASQNNSSMNSPPLQCSNKQVERISSNQQIESRLNQPETSPMRRPLPLNLSIPINESQILNPRKQGASHHLNQNDRLEQRRMFLNFEDPQMPPKLKRR